MRVTLIGHKLNIILESIGVTIHWDGQKMVSIEATAGLFNRTAGLCGTMDQNGENDFMSKDGTLHSVSLKKSFKVYIMGSVIIVLIGHNVITVKKLFCR